MTECCFCSEVIDSNEKAALTLVVVASDRADDVAAMRQELRCHAGCLHVRLRPDVPFDAEAFND